MYTPPADAFESARKKALYIGIVGLVACAVGFALEPAQAFRAWLVAFWTALGVGLGCMGLMMMQHLSGGAWGIFRRIFEAASRTIPLLAVLSLPILFGMQQLFPWTLPELVQHDEALRHKALYLSPTFFIVRFVVYFVVWSALSMVLNRLSLRQDSGDVSVNLPIQRVSGAGLVLYAITITFAAIDWIMSLNPHWYSTLFGFLIMGGQGLAGLCFTVVIAAWLMPKEPTEGWLQPNHFADLGKLIFAFVMLYAYFNFSQYLLTYAANLVEETPYMITRISNGWQYLSLFLTLFHFAVPLALLLSRDRKRQPRRLLLVALWLLLMRFFDLYLMISPEFSPAGVNLHAHIGETEEASRLFFHWMDLAAPLAVGGLWTWMFLSQLGRRPLFPVGDPYLRESLQTSGGH
jgi:hypothetical protein